MKLKKQGHSRIIYSQLISNYDTVRTICIKCTYLLNSYIDYDTYIKYFLNGYYCTISTKLRDFHYRLMANGIVSNRNLYHWKILNNDRCTFCNNARETLIHLLIECPKLQYFWNRVNALCHNELTLTDTLDMEKRNILFNTVHTNKAHIVNTFILLCKQYIYRCRCMRTIPNA